MVLRHRGLNPDSVRVLLGMGGEVMSEPTPEQMEAYLKWHNHPHAVSRYTAKDGERATLLWSDYEALLKMVDEAQKDAEFWKHEYYVLKGQKEP